MSACRTHLYSLRKALVHLMWRLLPASMYQAVGRRLMLSSEQAPMQGAGNTHMHTRMQGHTHTTTTQTELSAVTLLNPSAGSTWACRHTWTCESLDAEGCCPC